jgi:hypothetical protein
MRPIQPDLYRLRDGVETARKTASTHTDIYGLFSGHFNRVFGRTASVVERFLAQKLAVNGVRFDRPGHYRVQLNSSTRGTAQFWKVLGFPSKMFLAKRALNRKNTWIQALATWTRITALDLCHLINIKFTLSSIVQSPSRNNGKLITRKKEYMKTLCSMDREFHAAISDCVWSWPRGDYSSVN